MMLLVTLALADAFNQHLQSIYSVAICVAGSLFFNPHINRFAFQILL